MNIRHQLNWMAFIGIFGLLIFGAVAFTALFQVEVNGPLYRTISLSNNLIADYVPPSESLLQPARICAEITDAPDQESRLRYEAALKSFEVEYNRQYANYMARVPEGGLKGTMRGEAHDTALEYFRLADQVISLANQNHVDAARTLLVSTMNPLFDRHSAAVDQIVVRARAEARESEASAARSVRLYTAAMIALGLLVLITVGTLSLVIAREIGAQTDMLVRSEESRTQQAQLLESVISSMAEGVVAVDVGGNFKIWNGEVERLLGPSPKRFDDFWASRIGLYLPDGITLCPPERSVLFQAIHGSEAHAEFILKNPRDKSNRWIEVSARPIKDASGTTAGAASGIDGRS